MMRIVECRACGKQITFLKTLKGKSMPVDAESVYFVPDMNGPSLYVLPDGQVVRGCEARDEDPDKHIGYISHFATCPNGDYFRTKHPRKKDRKEAQK